MKLSRLVELVEDIAPYDIQRVLILGGTISVMLEARDTSGRLVQTAVVLGQRELKDSRYPDELIRTRAKDAAAQLTKHIGAVDA